MPGRVVPGRDVRGYDRTPHARRGAVTLVDMAPQQLSGGSELGRFLGARRTRITPGGVVLTLGRGMRRPRGLRRGERPPLAGISIHYYPRLERGKEIRPS